MFEIETSALGRIVVPSTLPHGFGLFYTTIDFHGRLNESIGDDIAAVIRQRFGIESTLATCIQVHGATVTRATPAADWRECDTCDALWSDDKSVALGIKVADCLPVTLIDAAHDIVANIHSGWRGAAQRITAGTVDHLARSSPFSAASAQAYLGPSIRVCCFEVGEEVASQFEARYVDRSRPKAHVDIPAMTVDLLRNRGFTAANIFDSGLCTRCDGSIFHSFRRDGRGGGRNLAIVAH